MDNEIVNGNLRGINHALIECPAGCGFFIVCWLVAAEEVPEEIIWLCMGKKKNELLKDVPIGTWARRPICAVELELDDY